MDTHNTFRKQVTEKLEFSDRKTTKSSAKNLDFIVTILRTTSDSILEKKEQAHYANWITNDTRHYITVKHRNQERHGIYLFF